ncbi:MAG TPA: methyltransferase domain-containing protein [Usitatibacter sp.]|jgi:SAM-dependent methyltransferase|nr:methyltransferase domain-containing protein [Usitatibacter sp.]
MKISAEYLDQNKRLHEAGSYGISGWRWAHPVRQLCEQLGTRDVLDYGCGQRTLEKSLGFPIHNFDPCIAGLDAPPEPADIVVCSDVLEHIEPDCLDEVLDDLARLTRRAGFLLIATRPAQKTLPDGRNAHLIQQPPEWWLPKLESRFGIRQFHPFKDEFAVIVRPLAAA